MIALIQRVTEASVCVEGEEIGRIGRGILAFVAVQPEDSEIEVSRMAERILTYRIFPDTEDRMNQSLLDQGLGLLLVPQFTLAADTKKGTRPSFTRAAKPDTASKYFAMLLAECRKRVPRAASGQFAANMQVSLVNDGPVTFWLET
jgi:D-tyrosyl-tRNA(Tyr) deacylase